MILERKKKDPFNEEFWINFIFDLVVKFCVKADMEFKLLHRYIAIVQKCVKGPKQKQNAPGLISKASVDGGRTRNFALILRKVERTWRNSLKTLTSTLLNLVGRLNWKIKEGCCCCCCCRLQRIMSNKSLEWTSLLPWSQLILPMAHWQRWIHPH